MAGRFKEYVYNPLFLADKYEEDIGIIDRAAIRADYSQMRKLANQRLKRFKGTQWEKSQIYKFNKNRFKRLDQIKSAEELATLVVEVRDFLNKPESTVSGQVSRTTQLIKSLHESGFNFVNKSNVSDFLLFMDRMRALGLASSYDSDQTAEIWNELRKEGVKPAELAEAFKTHSEEQLKNAPDKVGLQNVSANDIRRIYRKAIKP